MAFDSTGNLYIADSGNNRIRKVTGSVISTIAGNGTAGYSGDNAAATAAELNGPAGIITGATGIFYIADTGNNLIRKVSGGTISTIAGGGLSIGDNGPATSGQLAQPQAIALDSSGNIYVADTQNDRVRQLTPVPLTVASPSLLASGTIGVTYTPVTFTAAGGAGGYTWSATGLPKGMTFSGGGTFGGTPNTLGSSNIQFTVRDPQGNSATATISFSVVNPIPAITSLSPASGTVYGSAFTLTVNGSGFLTGATIDWNGSPLVTKVVSSAQLTAPVTAAMIDNPGTATITVSSAGTTSSAVTFSINAPTPGLTAMTPSSVVATSAAFTLTLTGTGFVSASQAEWNGTVLVTNFVSATQLTATVPASLVANTGTATVVVNSGQSNSSPLNFTVAAPPSIATLSPASVTAYSAAFTLTITGTGFAAGASVTWNTTALTAKFVSATQMTAAVPASLIGGAGNVNIIVTNAGVPSAASVFTINPPPPVITSLVPATAVATSAAFSLTIDGTGFTSSDTVQWGSTALNTTFVSPTQLNAYVPTGLIASAGNVSVVVSAGSVSSSSSPFTITAPPVITALNPVAAVQGGPSFTLTVNGTGFVSGAQIQWNGAVLPTAFLSSTQLTASISSSMVAYTGSVTIQVNSSGASSNGVNFAINGPPTISSLSPTSAPAGGAAFTLTVNGTGFLSGASVTWNGTALTTKFVSVTQLTASVTATQIATAGTASIAVSSGGTATSTLSLPMTPPPAIMALNPATVVGSGSPFTLTVSGTGFVSGTTIQWNGTALQTTYVSSTQLTAAVPANMAAGTGTASIVASNGSGQASVAVKLPITAALPAMTAGGVVPIYSSSPVIQPGSWVSIYGTGLANGTYVWTGNFPTTLGGTSVKINNKAAYLWSVSPTQINLQAPTDSTTGVVNVVVTTAAGSTTSTVTLAPYGPSLSLLPASNYAAGVILTNGTGAFGGGSYDLIGPTGAFSFSTRPVKAGETVELFGVGFGPTTPAVPAGKAYTGAAPTASQVTVTIGGVQAQVLFSGITEAGVYQLNIIMPQVPSGDQPLIATVSGNSTPTNVLITAQ